MSNYETIQVGSQTVAAELKELAQQSKDEYLAGRKMIGDAVVNPHGTGVQSLSIHSDGRVTYEDSGVRHASTHRPQAQDTAHGILATIRDQGGSVIARAPVDSDLVLVHGMPTRIDVAVAMGHLVRTAGGGYAEGPSLGK
jgi:hypothetical protein